MKRRTFLKLVMVSPFAGLLPKKKKVSRNAMEIRMTYQEINEFLNDCEKHLERVYLEKTGWPVHIKLSMNPSAKIKIVKGLI